MIVSSRDNAVTMIIANYEMENISKRLKYRTVEDMMDKNEGMRNLTDYLLKQLSELIQYTPSEDLVVQNLSNGEIYVFVFSKFSEMPDIEDVLKYAVGLFEMQKSPEALADMLEEIFSDPKNKDAVISILEKLYETEQETGSEKTVRGSGRKSERPVLYEMETIGRALSVSQYVKDGYIIKLKDKYFVASYGQEPALLEFANKETKSVLPKDRIICRIIDGKLVAKER